MGKRNGISRADRIELIQSAYRDFNCLFKESIYDYKYELDNVHEFQVKVQRYTDRLKTKLSEIFEDIK